RAWDFYREANRALFEAIRGMPVNEGGGMDVALVIAHLRSTGFFDRPDWQQAGEEELAWYLRTAASAYATGASAQAGAERLRRMALARRMAQLGASVQERIGAAPDDLDGVVTGATSELREIIAHRAFRPGAAQVADYAGAFADDIARVRREAWGLSGMVFGIGALDNPLGGLGEQRFVLIKGQSKFGKTTLAGQVFFETGVRLMHNPGDDNPVLAVYMLEDTRDKFLRRYVCWRAGVTNNHLRRGGSAMTAPDEDRRIRQALEDLNRLPLRICDHLRDVEEIEADLRQIALDHRVVGVLVDTAQQIRVSGRDSREQELSYAANRLVAVASELNTTIIAPSQVTIQVDGRHTEKHAQALREACTLSIEVERGEPGMPIHEKLKSPEVWLYCDAARDDAPLGTVKCHGDFARRRIYGDDEWQQLEQVRHGGREPRREHDA
ncbi:hypothetical protein HQ590_07160, partial [bacterium]|nr:hypothetical protein [bacterium]